MRRPASAQVGFVAANHGVPWGASECLWSAAAAALAGRDAIDVTVCVREWSADLPAVRALASAGCRVLTRPDAADDEAFERVEVPGQAARELAATRPDLVAISHGDNREGLPWLEFCLLQAIPFVTLAHRATEWDWPVSDLVPRLRSAYVSATAAHFVSEHNRRLTERTICTHLPQAAVVRNPYSVPHSDAPTWPGDDTLRLACVARLDLESKAHDVLLEVLAQPKWRERPLHLEIIGREGPHQQLIRDMQAFAGLERVTFDDGVDRIGSVWERCHALVLPSRKEGLPVAVVEAMLSERPCLVTDVGGAAELVEPGLSGWVAESPTVPALDRALEAAWAARADWKGMGLHAGRAARSSVPADPAASYADRLEALL